MGHLLGAVTQEKLDNQRGVVQNEKRQGDNQPYGLVEYEQLENLYPARPPLSPLDDRLDGRPRRGLPRRREEVVQAITTARTTRCWCWPATSTRRPRARKVSEWFGAIPAGPRSQPIAVPVPTLPAKLDKTITRQGRHAADLPHVGGAGARQPPTACRWRSAHRCSAGSPVSRLDDALVRQRAGRGAGFGQCRALRAGRPVRASGRRQAGRGAERSARRRARRRDRQVHRRRARPPTSCSAPPRVYAASEIRGLESVGGFGGKAPTLAEGLLYNGDPGVLQDAAEAAAAMTPGEVRAATAEVAHPPGLRADGRTRHAHRGRREPRRLPTAPEAATRPHPAYYWRPAQRRGRRPSRPRPSARTCPPVDRAQAARFPRHRARHAVQRHEGLSSPRRDAVPTVSVRIDFDAGYAADPRDKLGAAIADAAGDGRRHHQPRFAPSSRSPRSVSARRSAASPDSDTTGFCSSAHDAQPCAVARPAGGLCPPTRPSTPPTSSACATQQLTAHRNEAQQSQPRSRQRALLPMLYGPSPLWHSAERDRRSGSGRAADARRSDRFPRQLAAARHRPSVFVVGDTTLPKSSACSRRASATGRPPQAPPRRRTSRSTSRRQTSRIILIDRPSLPAVGHLRRPRAAAEGHRRPGRAESPRTRCSAAASSAASTSNLRETKGWSYGVSSADPVAGSTAQLPDLRAGPGRPHRRIDR